MSIEIETLRKENAELREQLRTNDHKSDDDGGLAAHCLSVRDHFAAAALSALLLKPRLDSGEPEISAERYARLAFQMAAAMLDERENDL